MKHYKLIIGSILLGGLMAFFFYKDIKYDVIALTNNEDSIYLFQVGVYNNIDNANNKLNEYSANNMFYQNNYYRVISAICYSEETCNVLKNYFSNKNIKYYLKKYNVSKNLIKSLENNEKIINTTTNDEVITIINKKNNTLFINYLK